MSQTHQLSRDTFHGEWDPTLPPRLTIASGDSVVFETRDASNGKVRDRISSEVLDALPADLRQLIHDYAERYRNDPWTPGHALTGPVVFDGASPGDVLQIDVVAIEAATWGWTSFSPGFGLLADEFDYGHVQVWDLRDGRDAELKPGIRVPLEPFCGVMGVAPDVPEPVSTLPPRTAGGNMDVKQLTAGSTLYLPVQAPGALFSAGDAHGAQGDGEVCGAGIEMESITTLRFTLRRDLALTQPRFETFGPLPGGWNVAGHIATTGIGPDLFEATREAIRQMIALLVDDFELSRAEAYVLCSVAVDLKISEVVDAPNWLVSAFLPKGLFVA
ncbi:MAG: acetamidase/formamidase family protein [Thermomicrobiales bacterium]